MYDVFEKLDSRLKKLQERAVALPVPVKGDSLSAVFARSAMRGLASVFCLEVQMARYLVQTGGTFLHLGYVFMVATKPENSPEKLGRKLLNEVDHIRPLDEKKVDKWISQGASLSEKTFLGDTALHLAVLFGHVSVAEKLLTAGADPDARNNKGQTPIDAWRKGFDRFR